jgi:hypothetical protein
MDSLQPPTPAFMTSRQLEDRQPEIVHHQPRPAISSASGMAEI